MLTLEVSRRGRRGGPPLLLLHGLGASAGWWDGVIQQLDPGFDLVLPDLRGHGRSPWAPDGDYAAANHARDVLALLLRLRLPPPLVVGHSFGGVVGLALAGRAPSRVAGLLMLDAPLLPPPSLMRPLREVAELPPVVFASLERAVQSFRPFPRDHRASPQLLARVARGAFRPLGDGRPGWTACTDRAAYRVPADGDPLAVLAALQVPAAFVRGGRSRVVGPRSLARLRERAPDVPISEIESAGHHIPLDAPEATARAIEAFASGRAAEPAAGWRRAG